MIRKNNLRKLRRMADLTQQNLADAIGVTIKTIQNYEGHKTEVPDIAKQKIANLLRLDESVIFPYWEI